ncbi:Ribonuclease H-like superfamily [Sesbania bispinosa]|nr:Ribonuclease H-like superfamily [Sesbania bispinosa]
MKLNIDGSFNHSTGSIAIGGVLRDSNSFWHWGFSAQGGLGNILEAKFLALKTGLQYAWEKKHWEVRITHILREANLLVDHLARSRSTGVGSVMYWDSPPQGALDILAANSSF